MKKFFALLLALVMVLSLVACGDKKTDDNQGDTNTDDQQGETTTYTNPDDIEDNMTSEDGKYEIAFVTDVGQLKDKSFNQGTFDGVKLYAANNGLSYKYYQPANGDQATDDDRYDAMKAAVDGGAKVVVCAGFMQEKALKRAAEEFTDTSFVFIDGYSLKDSNDQVLSNVAGIAFKEEQCGYFAGYAVVKEGYEKLGFTGGGGGTNPACIRYGWGFAQGANDAAKEMNKTVDLNYSWEYGASFQASPELQTMVSGWYSNGTEIVFACGGSMFQSVAAAASAEDGKVVGVDVDQSSESETVVTSAMKGLSDAAVWAIAKVYDGTFSEIGGTDTSLGVAENSVGLPTDTWSMENFTVADYEELFQKVLNGELTINNNDKMANPDEGGLTNVNVNYIGG
ncbi:BMP family protein [Oscillibacter sp. ER4]|uniref:BMP family lipoprotein n=1 Tax=Oscillibacter sp. ER4 TaxID=1519439 RepID=UPI00051BB929|nr:BMP family ABC transporter substrate-binding protein [Oscillibacter sp. ER4]